MGKKERRTFSDEIKEQAVLRADAGRRTFAQISREIGIHPSLLQTWRRKYGHGAATEAEKAVTSSQEGEIRRLRRENATLREDREILKKAVATSLPRNPDELRVHWGAESVALRAANVRVARGFSCGPL